MGFLEVRGPTALLNELQNNKVREKSPLPLPYVLFIHGGVASGSWAHRGPHGPALPSPLALALGWPTGQPDLDPATPATPARLRPRGSCQAAPRLREQTLANRPRPLGRRQRPHRRIRGFMHSKKKHVRCAGRQMRQDTLLSPSSLALPPFPPVPLPPPPRAVLVYQLVRAYMGVGGLECTTLAKGKIRGRP
jgi:hypothetical protein